MIWKDVGPALAANGYRVLLYGEHSATWPATPHLIGTQDLYGRGYSDAPQTTYDPTLYSVQLALLMQHIKWEKATVIGVSMVSHVFPQGI
jgi:pimeloyl-ACP methyl ester carboxylesterase